MQSSLSPMERSAVVVLDLLGAPRKAISTLVSCSPKATKRWIDRYAATGSVEDEQRGGRPKLLKAGAVEAIKHHATEQPHESTPKQLRRLLDFDCSARTIRRTMDDLGLLGRVARYTPPLNEVHRLKRMSFVDGYKDMDWTKVLWSDEASVELGPHGQRWVQRPENEHLNPRYTLPRTKHPDKCHIWGCMSSAGVGRCYIFTEYLEKKLMRDILKENLVSSALSFWPQGMWWFQQDNDPKHKSHLVQEWLFNSGITCLDWPPYSPDLNPIEHVWSDVKRRVEAAQPKDVEELMEELKQQWYATEPDMCRELVASMPRRMEAARKHGGWMSGY